MSPNTLASLEPPFHSQLRPIPLKSTQKPRINGTFVSILLCVSMLTPYGLLPVGGGALRLDHLLIPLFLFTALIRGRIRAPSALAWGLILMCIATTLGTFFFTDYFFLQLKESLKNIDAMVRSTTILLVASSFDATDAGTRRIIRTIKFIAAILALMAVIERFAPQSSTFVSLLVQMYGGPIPTEPFLSAYVRLGVNHKGMLILANRASAVFPTAPALAMASSFLLLLVLSINRQISRREKILLVGCALVAGLSSNSKSFIFGFPLVGLLAASSGRIAPIKILAPVFLGLLGYGAITLMHLQNPDFGVNPISDAAEGGDDLYTMTGGRMGGDDWSIWDVLVTVISESPLLGYGFGLREGLIYSDSGFNRIALHAGILGLVIVAYTSMIQIKWFRSHSKFSEWSGFGASCLTLAIAFFFAGPVFMMPRINDLIFTLIGVSYAHTCHAVTRDNHAWNHFSSHNSQYHVR